MDKSQSISNLAKALVLFHVKVEKVSKDATNPFFKSKYASLSNILEAINIPLNESGLTFSQFPTGEHGLTTILMHAESGEFLQSEYIIKPVPEYAKEKDRDGNVLWRAADPHITPQGIGSSITYQRRYALAAVLGLNIDEDDDANHGTGLNGHANENTKQPANNLPWLNKDTKEHKGAIAKLTAGTTTLANIKAVFKLSKDMEKELSAIKPITKPALQNQN